MNALMNRLCISLIIAIAFNSLPKSYGQCINSQLSLVDTVCVNEDFNIQFDSIFSGTIGIDPCANQIQGIDTIYSHPQLASQIPGTTVSLSLVQDDNGNWYGFSKSPNLSSLVRFSFGQSLSNIPTVQNIATTSSISLNTGSVGAIKFIKINGMWHGITTLLTSRIAIFRFDNGLESNTLDVRVIFDASLFPNPRNLDIEIVNDSIVIGVLSSDGTIAMLNFGDTLFNPIYTAVADPVDPLDLSAARTIEIIGNCDEFHVFVTGITRRKLNHIFYGNSLFNTPTNYVVEQTNLLTPIQFASSVRDGKVLLWLKHSTLGFTIYEFPLTMDSLLSETSFGANLTSLTGDGFDIVEHNGRPFAATIQSTTKELNIVELGEICGANIDTLVWNDSISLQFNSSGENWGNVVLRDDYGISKYYPFKSVINERPSADFLIEGVCKEDTTYFIDLSASQNSITSWNWDFGDSNGSNLQNTSHIYLDSGNYLPTLTVTDSNGCSNSFSDTITIRLKPLPIVVIGLSCQGKVTDISDQSQFFENSFYETSTWIINNVDSFSGQEIDPIFLDTGNISLSLITSDTNGCASRIDTSLHVLPSPIINFDLKSTCIGDTVEFMNFTSSYEAFTGLWLFGDGDSSLEYSTAHTYQDTGLYEVQYFATTNSSCSDTAAVIIRISSSPVPGITLPELEVCSGETNVFQDNSQLFGDTIRNSLWFLGLDSAAGLSVEFFTPSPISNLLLTHELVVGTDCRVLVEENLTVFEGITNQILPSSFCAGDSILFENNSNIPMGQTLASSVWHFGTGDSSILNNATYLYADPGQYNLRLTQSTDIGCESKLDTSIQILSAPITNFELLSNICTGQEININGHIQVDPMDTLLQSFWIISGDTTYLPNVLKTDQDTVSLDIRLVAMTGKGCKSEAYLEAPSYQTPKASIDYDTACAGDPTHFRDLYSGSNYFWLWTIDEQIKIEEDDPSYIFLNSGLHDVELSITDKITGCSSKDTASVAVAGIDSIKLTSDILCDGEKSFFYVNASVQFDEISQIAWLYGQSELLGSVGFFKVDTTQRLMQVQVTTKKGCMSTRQAFFGASKQIAPNIKWSANETDNFTITFQVTNYQYFNQIYWRLGSTIIGSGEDFSYRFDSIGLYSIYLIVQSEDSCTSENEFTVIVGDKPVDLRLRNIEKSTLDNGDISVFAELANLSKIKVDSFELILRTNNNTVIRENFIQSILPNDLVQVRFKPTLIDNTATVICAEVASVNGLKTINNDQKCILDTDKESISKIYPNPAQNNINFLIGTGEELDLRIEIYEVKGTLVTITELNLPKVSTSHQVSLDISNLNQGLYILKIFTEDNQSIYIQKFVKS